MTSTGVTAMHFASQGDFGETVRTLAAAGADVNAPDHFQSRTPLVFAASRNATGAISALLEAGADPSLQTDLKDYVARSDTDRDERARRARIRAAERGDEVVFNDNADRFQQTLVPPDSAAADGWHVGQKYVDLAWSPCRIICTVVPHFRQPSPRRP